MTKKEIVEKIEKQLPLKKSKNSEVYEINEFIVKVFKYKNFFHKITSLKGLRSYLIFKILKLKKINIPEFISYFSLNNSEIFIYRKIIGEVLEKKIKKEENQDLIEKLKKFTKSLFEKGVYHKDYDPTNIIVDKNGELYLIDLENVSFFLTEKRKKKMLRKLNRLLKNPINII